MHSFLEITKDWFFEKYFTKLQKRFWTFKIALNLFLQRDSKIVVETGTQRGKDDWDGGCSTTIFGDFCKKYDKHLYTIDNNVANLEISRRDTNEFATNITYELNDSIRALKNFDSKIDLLYLDSLDCKKDLHDQNIEAQTHALNELKAAYDKLSSKSIIIIDDNLFTNGGKTRMCKERLRKKGWICLMDYKQTLWIRK